MLSASPLPLGLASKASYQTWRWTAGCSLPRLCVYGLLNDGAACRRDPPDGERAADVRTHALAERQHVPAISKRLEILAVAVPGSIRSAFARDLALGVCCRFAQQRPFLVRHRPPPYGNLDCQQASSYAGEPSAVGPHVLAVASDHFARGDVTRIARG